MCVSNFNFQTELLYIMYQKMKTLSSQLSQDLSYL